MIKSNTVSPAQALTRMTVVTWYLGTWWCLARERTPIQGVLK